MNLWELLTGAEANHRRYPDQAFGPKITVDDLVKLGKSARFCNGTELSLEATDAGWVIKVFSCFGDGPNNDIEILIPKDWKAPVKVVRDQVGRMAHLHD